MTPKDLSNTNTVVIGALTGFTASEIFQRLARTELAVGDVIAVMMVGAVVYLFFINVLRAGNVEAEVPAG